MVVCDERGRIVQLNRTAEQILGLPDWRTTKPRFDELPLEQVTKQLNKLVEVIKIVELDGTSSVSRELMMVKVKADAATRGQVLEVAQIFKGKVVDVAPDAITIQVVGHPEKLADFLRVIEPYGVRELVQATLDLVRGLGLAGTITDDTRRRHRILDQWAATLDARLGA